jgi:hypothetical protein
LPPFFSITQKITFKSPHPPFLLKGGEGGFSWFSGDEPVMNDCLEITFLALFNYDLKIKISGGY